MTTDYVKRHGLKPTMRAFSVNDTVINGAPEHPTEYKFLYIPESYSDPSTYTPEIAPRLKIHGASHLGCAPGCRHNDIICLIIGNPYS